MKSAEPIRLLVVDDHAIVREGLIAVLERETDLCVVAEAAEGREALERYRQYRPDVVLTDLRMPGMSGLELVSALRAEDPEARVVVLTTYDGDEDIYQCLKAGARAYLLKDVPRAELMQTILGVYAGHKRISPAVGARLTERMDRESLSARELDVVRLMVQGMTNQEIARTLFIAEGTVKFHVNNIVSKLHAHDRTQAVIHALKRGIAHLH